MAQVKTAQKTPTLKIDLKHYYFTRHIAVYLLFTSIDRLNFQHVNHAIHIQENQKPDHRKLPSETHGIRTRGIPILVFLFFILVAIKQITNHIPSNMGGECL